MTLKPHLAAGLFSGAMVSSCFQISDHTFTTQLTNMVVGSIATGLGTIAPDADCPGTPAARILPFISKRWSHRTLWHSLLGALIASFIIYCIADFIVMLTPLPHNIAFIFFAYFLSAYLTHICFVDVLTITGVPLLWPLQRCFAYPSEPRHRVLTGSKREHYYTIFYVLLFVSYLPVLQSGGATRSIHRAFKNYEMAKQDFQHAIGIETHLSFQGSYRKDRTPVSGTGLILDATTNHFIISYNNTILTVGDQALILGTSYVCEYSDHAPTLTELTITHQPLDTIISKLNENTLILGRLTADKTFQATAPVYTSADFATIQVNSNTINLQYATPQELSLLNVRLPERVRKLQTDVRTLQTDITTTNDTIEKLTKTRTKKKDLVVRYNLQTQITELKSHLKKLTTRLETSSSRLAEYGGARVLFSGKLVLREVRTLNSDTHP